MPRITDNYRFYALTEFRDVWYPGYDQRNMVTSENQLEALYQFVGPGVLEGWEVTPMPSALRAGDVVDMDERSALADAEAGTYLAKVYQLIGSPDIDDELAWGQVLKVTEGRGIVGVFAAETVQTAYFRLSEPNTVLYAWAEAGLCLAPEGRCHITVPSDGDYDHDQTATATYLATIEVTELDDHPGEGFILAVTYDERRKALRNLQGALDDALQRAFYRHVHLGGPDHPSKINLSTYVVFETEGPAGSTILRVIVPPEYEAKWLSEGFGIPVVRLNDEILADTDYTIDYAGKRIFLRNSLPAGASVTIKLPLFDQVSLFLHEDSLISDSLQSANPDRQRPIYLTDGSTTTDENGDTHQVIYTWDEGAHRPPVVTLDGADVDSSLYTLYPEDGAINFNPPLSSEDYDSDSLSVVLTSLGQEVENTLSGERLEDLDASVFARGTLDPRRIRELDHVGLVRFKELAVLRPTKRLLQLGDDIRFYPEVVGEPLQYASHLYHLYRTVNLPAEYAIGSRRGLIESEDLLSFNLRSTWVPDRGRPKKFVDDLLQDDSQQNHFSTIYLLTYGGRGKKGAVFYSSNQGSGFVALRMPVDAGVTVDASDFHASTQKVQQQTTSGVKTFEYSTLYYLGTDRGLWTATVQEGMTQDDWTWTREDYAEDQVHALLEICTKRVTTDDEGDSTESQDRTLYVGADDGFYVGSGRINGEEVKGFFRPREGSAKNQLFWFTDTEVFYSHTARFVQQETGDGGGTTYWEHPLTDAGTVRYEVAVASVEGVTLPSVSSIDGVSLSDGDLVLLKDQDDPAENGVYEYEGGLLTLIPASQGEAVRVEVEGGGTLDGSAWRCRPDDGDYTFEHLWVRATSKSAGHFQSIFQEAGTNQFYALSSTGDDRCIRLTVVVDGDTFDRVDEEAAPWSNEEQGAPSHGLSAGSAIYVGGDRGLWRSSDSGESWSRPVKQFTSFDSVTAYHTLTGERVADTEFSVDADTQAITFNDAREPWSSYLYEREYTNYYVASWNPVNADVIVYVNDEVTEIPYALFPDEGRIFFTQTLSPDDEVRITIIRQGAFISNVGSTPHEELQNATVTGTTSLTLLAADLVGLAPAGTEVVLRDRTKVPIGANLLELRYRTFQERVGVLVDPDTNRVTLARDRMGDNLFPANFTEVYLVEVRDILGIEDEISIANSNQTYHLNSLVGVNVAQLSMTAEEKDAGLYSNFSRPAGPGFEPDRGPKSALFFNSLTDSFDDSASSSTVFAGMEPSETDQPFNPRAVYCLHAIAVDGEGMRAGTDQGIWIYEGGQWKKESDLNGSARVYFIESRDGVLVAGTDEGLWQMVGGEWSQNPLYPQAVFDRDSGDWFDGEFEAFGKDDGLAFVWTVDDEPFTSDPFLAVAERRVYGLYKDKFIRIKEDGKQEQVDALYLATEAGLYGVTNGATAGTYSAFLTGREMFGEGKLTRQYTDGDGDLVTADVKIYRIFRALPRPACPPGESKPSIPIHILTNNGIYKVRNWRWCDPANSAGLDFHAESHNLAGVTCNCFALATRQCADGVEPLSKIFVGTESGVWRSYNEGTTYERCERLGGDLVAVYDLQAFEGGLVASTERGIYFSDDDGDSWRRPDPDDSNALLQFSHTVSGAVGWSGTYLAQTFKPVTGQTEVTRVGAYLSVDYPESHDDPESLLENYLTLELWSTDGAGKPLAPLPSHPPVTQIAAADVTHPGFQQVELSYTLPDSTSTYALVAREYPSAGSGGTKVFRWHISTLDNPYSNGKAWQYNLAWTAVPAHSEGGGDLFFRVFFEPESEAQETQVNINLLEGEGRGLIADDSGALTTDMKFAGVFVLDDTQSMAWGDPDDGFGNATRGDQLTSIMSELWRRTKHDYTTETYYRSWGDVFTFGSSIIDRTNGYTNSPDTLELYLGGLFQRGQVSALNETAQLALSTLFPQAVVDAILEADNAEDLVQEVVDYLVAVDALRLQDIEEWFQDQPEGTRSDWPYDHPDPEVRIATINNYSDVSEHVVTRWANTFMPVAIVCGDGDDTGSQDAADVALTAVSGWPRGGVGIVALGTDGGHRQVDLKTQADQSGGVYATVVRGTAGGDWEAVEESLLHGGANDLFRTGWSPKYEFEEAKWVRSVEATFSAAPGAACSVSFRVSKDRVNWTAWQELESEVATSVDDLIYGIEFAISMSDGWDEVFEVPIKPRLESLVYTEVNPGRTYLITEEQEIGGMLFEYLLSPVVDVPRTARLNWGICRGASRDFADFERIRSNRKGCLPHRQKSAQFSDEVVRLLLPTSTSDNQAYQVLDENNQPTNWLPDDIVQVYVGGIEVRLDPENPFYTYDYALGRIYFRDELPAGSVVRVTITTPAELFVYDGEPMNTVDGRVYRAANGRWPADAQAVVMVNGKVQRGNYWATPEEGTVAFIRELERTNIVTLYVQHAGVFRVGVELLDYGTEPTLLERFGLFYTHLRNGNVLYHYNNPEPPEVVERTLELAPEDPTSYTRLTIEYTYRSPDGARERASQTSWWRYRPGEDTSGYAEVDSDGYVRLSDVNGFSGGEDYDNRTVQRSIDVGSQDLFRDGDRFYVKVTPHDGFVYGAEVDSRPAVQLGDNSPPWVTNLAVTAPTKETVDGVDYVAAGSTLTAQYVFHDLDGASDQSTITWYERDGAEPVGEGSTLSGDLVTAGKVFSFQVTPYDGEHEGIRAQSGEVTAR